MKNVFVTTIRKYQEEQDLIQEKTRKYSIRAFWIIGIGTGGMFLGGLAALGDGHQHTELGPHLAAGLMGALFGTLALLVTRTNYRYGKLNLLKLRFQADVRAYAEGQHGLAVQHSIIEPDLDTRVGLALKGEIPVPVKVHFPDEDSPLQVVELAEKSTP